MSVIRAAQASQRLYPPMYMDGCAPTYISATTVRIGLGSCRSDDDTLNIDVTSTIDIVITTVGVNGRDSATAEAASTWYSVWVISDSTGVNVEAGLFGTSATAPTLPSGYDVKRRIGWVRNDASSNFVPYEILVAGSALRMVTYSEYVITGAQPLLNGTATTFTSFSLATLIPPTARHAILIVQHAANAIGGGVRLRATGSTQGFPISIQYATATNPTFGTSSSTITIKCSSSQAIEYQNLSAGGAVSNVYTYGYWESLTS